jgi:tetratricopeptide (TPR) repeat protein
MRSRLTIVASFAALLTFAASASAQAPAQSDSGQAIPDAPAPQPQKKPAPKPPPPSDSKDSSSPSTPPADAPAPKQPPAKDDNPFPEAVSRDAAKAASDGAGTTKTPAANDNPFPEAVSRDAAKAAGNDQNPAPKSDLPPGVSSSQSTDLGDTDTPAGARRQLPSPGRAKKDTDVGGFYMDSGNYQGALERYQDAMANDPTNVDAIFGMAEAQQMLKKNADAARNYQLYLDIVPNGPKSKQAMKALKTLQAAK